MLLSCGSYQSHDCAENETDICTEAAYPMSALILP
nr:MAG TPA: hypothetical protein [Caudoviricetes sp.]